MIWVRLRRSGFLKHLTNMSNRNNEVWLEAARLNFADSLEAGDYHTCKLIIADVQGVDLEVGRELNERLRNTPFNHFTIQEKGDY